jgi:vacuolar-type H+-ATPase subunit H
MTMREVEILKEIKESERLADDLIEKANKESQKIVEDARKSSAERFNQKTEEISKAKGDKIAALRVRASSLKNEKINLGKKVEEQLLAKSSKNIDKAVNFVIKKFEEMI